MYSFPIALYVVVTRSTKPSVINSNWDKIGALGSWENARHEREKKALELYIDALMNWSITNLTRLYGTSRLVSEKKKHFYGFIAHDKSIVTEQNRIFSDFPIVENFEKWLHLIALLFRKQRFIHQAKLLSITPSIIFLWCHNTYR